MFFDWTVIQLLLTTSKMSLWMQLSLAWKTQNVSRSLTLGALKGSPTEHTLLPCHLRILMTVFPEVQFTQSTYLRESKHPTRIL